MLVLLQGASVELSRLSTMSHPQPPVCYVKTITGGMLVSFHTLTGKSVKRCDTHFFFFDTPCP